MFYVVTPHKISELTEYHNLTFDDLFAEVLPPATQAREASTVNITKTYNELNQIPTSVIDLMSTKNYEFIRRFDLILHKYSDKDMHEFYTTFQIPKQSGGVRTIKAPNNELKLEMRMILSFLQEFLYAHQAAYAYVPNRCTKNLIEAHQVRGYEWFLKMDLHDFFGSCNPQFISNALRQLPLFNMMRTDVFTRFVHFIALDNGLPQGTPLSPFITNMLMVATDNILQQTMHQHHAFYTRYADDMIVSTTSRQAAIQCQRAIEQIIGEPFSINRDKTRISSINGKNWNLGLMYNKDKKITVGYKNKERFRATLNEFCKNHASTTPQTAMELLGKIQYYLGIEQEYFEAVLTKYALKYNMDIRATLIAIIKTQ